MRVGYLQFDVGRVADANVEFIETSLAGVDADLVVLPELCTTGYLFESTSDLAAVAEPIDGPSVARLSALAVTNGTTLVFGIAELDGPSIFNAAVIATPDGAVATRRKRHLSRIEQPRFTPGGPAEVLVCPTVTLGALTCFDAWFPERSRLLAQQGAEVVCCPSNFGGPDSLDVFRVRALENRVFVIVANRIGDEALGPVSATFRGQSRVISPDGVVLIAADDQAVVHIVEIDPAAARRKASVMSRDLAAEWATYTVGESSPADRDEDLS